MFPKFLKDPLRKAAQDMHPPDVSRTRKVLQFLSRQPEVLKVRERINTQVQEEMGRNQREYVLRRIDPDTVLATVTATAAPGGAQPPAGDGTQATADPVRGIRPADGAEAFRRLLATPLGAQVVVSAVRLPEFLAEGAGEDIRAGTGRDESHPRSVSRRRGAGRGSGGAR